MSLSFIVSALIVLLVIAVILGVFFALVPVDAEMKRVAWIILVALVAVILLVWLLQAVGLLNGDWPRTHKVTVSTAVRFLRAWLPPRYT